ncbi:nucleotide sugar dehydrogenase [Paenibacillus xylaniclasticus]|uniref:nucleotide sugar dehydrogenase n=1 Tax=Paenibacillus xylaniclasticus TaxID=588083 RepID=UPI000FD70B41|nr:MULTISPECIES: nucleotide sugar dehydrogenase [Paenibacillus]GFN32279.1 UDP-N-acetyl-D-glucosamine dehydrogenase [Paenibacillus curdlanolyticus]
MHLQLKIKNKEAKIGIVGMGYVGLPLALEFARAGFPVTGIDLNEDKVRILNNGDSYIVGVDHFHDVITEGKFRATTDFQIISTMDVICICVPTPLSKNQDPDLTYIRSVVEELKKYMTTETLVVLESTTYPGTTDEIIGKELANIGLHAGNDYYLCYSPERVDPGNKKYSIRNTPKVIGGATPKCLELGEMLYASIVESTVKVTSTRSAEMSKLLENTFRSVNIAFINEIALLCDRLGVSVWEVIQAAATKPFGFMPFYPGPGIGGHCIPLDPMYLSWKAKGENFFSRFIELSQDMNRNMPRYVVQKISDVLNAKGKPINGSKILLLGMAYKPDVNDWRESPSLEVYELLHAKGAKLTANDPFCDTIVTDGGYTIKPETVIDKSSLPGYDCVVLLTAHSSYHLPDIVNSGVPVLDTRNAFAGMNMPNVVRIGDAMPALQQKERTLMSV